MPRAAQHAAGMSRYPSNLRRGGGSTAGNALACVLERDKLVRADENVPSRQNGLLGEIPRDGLPRHLLLPLKRPMPIPLYQSTTSLVYNSRMEMTVTLRALRQ